MRWRLLSILLLLALASNAQKRAAQKYFQEARQQEHVDEAIALYQKAIAKDSSYTEAYLALAELYERLRAYDRQQKTLETATRKAKEKQEILSIQLAKAAYLNGQYQVAYDALKNLNTITEPQLVHLQKCVHFSLEGIQKAHRIEPYNLGPELNTKYNDYWPSLSIDEKQIVSTVLIDEKENLHIPPQEDFYVSVWKDQHWTKSQALSPIINSAENEGAQSLSADGKTMLFTACNRADGYGACDIYITHQINGVWSPPQALPPGINTNSWEGHPSLSADGTQLFFASDREGGFGGRDLYQAEINLSNNQVSVGQIRNLGEFVNTPRNEISPFIHADGQSLYFSSDGHVGFGRQDIYLAKKDSNGVFSQITNLGYPINSHKDDIGLVINASGSRAYFATEREDSRQKDIYAFDLPVSLRPQEVSYFKAKVSDKVSGQALDAEVELKSISSDALTFHQENKSEFIVPLPIGQSYAIQVTHPHYLFYSAHFALTDSSERPFIKEIQLSPIRKGEVLILKNIFFKHNSAKLDTSYMAELDKALALIKHNPTFNFEISGHTDKSGSDDYNQQLSEQRAKVVYDYFINHGISPTRLSYRGYGSSKPISQKDSYNRRTELLIK